MTYNSQFLVKDFVDGYDNQYNDALLAKERSEAIQAVLSHVGAKTLELTTHAFRQVGRGAVAVVEAFDEAIQA